MSIILGVLHYFIVALCVLLAAVVFVQRLAIARLKRLVNTDQLTGVHNRFYFEEFLKRTDRVEYFPITLIYVDVDKLKLVNDTCGHACGDRLLTAAAEILTGLLPKRAKLCRVGGDEFAIVIPNCDEMEAAEYIRAVKIRASAPRDEEPVNIEMSMGFAIRTDMNEDMAITLERADQAMYSEKILARKEFPRPRIN